MRDDIVFSTPWFPLLARHVDDAGTPPYYCLDTFDYVSVVALDEAGQLVVVKQFRASSAVCASASAG